jgi:hypothetical protein
MKDHKINELKKLSQIIFCAPRPKSVTWKKSEWRNRREEREVLVKFRQDVRWVLACGGK